MRDVIFFNGESGHRGTEFGNTVVNRKESQDSNYTHAVLLSDPIADGCLVHFFSLFCLCDEFSIPIPVSIAVSSSTLIFPSFISNLLSTPASVFFPSQIDF